MTRDRATLREAPARLDDAVFVAWAICLPFFRQPREYSELMRARRSEWFEGVAVPETELRAHSVFSEDLLRLELDELAAMVSARDAALRIIPYLGELPPGSSSSPAPGLTI